MTTDALPVTLADVQAAAKRIEGHVHRTPVLTSAAVNARVAPYKVHFKCENLQKVGAFKIRGAVNAVKTVQEEKGEVKDVVTHSSGNHAQAVACACQLLGLNAHVVMPTTAPLVKRKAVEDTYQAKVYICEPSKRAERADEVAAETGGVFVHPSNDVRVIAGQGTVGLEFFEQTNGELDAVIVPVGGGGLIGGVSTAFKGLNPNIRIFGAEPRMADDAARSIDAGKILPHEPGKPNSIADGLLTTLGDNTYPLIKHNVEKIICVEEAEIAAALRFVMERLKIVIEPSAAVGVAALLGGEFPLNDPSIKNVGVVLCGGNLELDRLADYLNAGSTAA